MDLLQKISNCKPVKGKRLAEWLERFLAAPADSLATWHGNFTEVMTAKVVGILRKRGVLEEAEADRLKFDRMVNIAYRLPAYEPEVKEDKSATASGDEPVNPLHGRELLFEPGGYEQKNRSFFGRLVAAAPGTVVWYYADAGGSEYYDVLGIAGDPQQEAIPAPVFAAAVGLPQDEGLQEIIKQFLSSGNFFSVDAASRSDWEGSSVIGDHARKEFCETSPLSLGELLRERMNE